MRYAREFNRLDYNVPEFLLNNLDWEDVSWHNDTCPRWENKELQLAIWVDCIEPLCREYDDWAQYTVVPIQLRSNDIPLLSDDAIFATEDSKALKRFIDLFTIRMHINIAIDYSNEMDEPCEEIADGLVTLYTQLTTLLTQ